MIGKKWIEMTKKLPSGHNIGGSTKQKRRKENKQTKNKKIDKKWTLDHFLKINY